MPGTICGRDTRKGVNRGFPRDGFLEELKKGWTNLPNLSFNGVLTNNLHPPSARLLGFSYGIRVF